MTLKRMLAVLTFSVPLLAARSPAAVSTTVTISNMTADLIGTTGDSSTRQSGWSVGVQPGAPRVVNVTAPSASPQSMTVWIEDEKTHAEASCMGTVDPTKPEAVSISNKVNGLSCLVGNKGALDVIRTNALFKNATGQPLGAIIEVVQDGKIQMDAATGFISGGNQTSEETQLASRDPYTVISVILGGSGTTVASCMLGHLNPGTIRVTATGIPGAAMYRCSITQL